MPFPYVKNVNHMTKNGSSLYDWLGAIVVVKNRRITGCDQGTQS